MQVKEIWGHPPASRLTWNLLAAVYVACFVFWIALSQTLYGGHIQSFPTRLDVTLDLWRSAGPAKHWFMFFLTTEDVGSGTPYANMPYLYTIYYAAYHLILNFVTFGVWPFATTYLMTMIAMLTASWFILRPVIAGFSVRNAFMALGVVSGILVTSPYVTGYLLQFNHDTSFTFNAVAATVLAFAFWRNEGRAGAVVWVALSYCVISGWLGLVTLGCCFLRRRSVGLNATVFYVLFTLNVTNLLVPLMVAHFVFHQTSASGLLFRTGLDGATNYFTGHWQAFFSPFQPRSVERELSIKLVVLVGLIGIAWWRFGTVFVKEGLAFGVALLAYLSHWIIFPQSVSIHPYLYDMLFLLPLDMMLAVVAAGVVVRLKSLTEELAPVLTLALVSLVLHDNLLLLAQGIFIQT